MAPTRRPLKDYFALQYPFQVIADPDGGYVIIFPDLPGCMTQADSVDEIPEMAEDARRAWVAAVYEDGEDVPLPSYPEEYSGKFNVRLPRSLHRSLAEAADRDGISLNQYVLTLLARRDAQAQVERRLDDVVTKLDAIQARLRYSVSIPSPAGGVSRYQAVLADLPARAN